MQKLKQNWANLEALPLSLVLGNLEERIDHVRFGAVCKNWQSIAKLNHQNNQFKTNTLPMLVTPLEVFWTQPNMKTWWLFSIPNKKYYPFPQVHQLRLDNPELRLCGSSHGWLALALLDCTIALVNLFKDIPSFFLPPLNLVYKVTSFADPIKSPDDYIIVAIFDKIGYYENTGKIAFIRRGQTRWTCLDSSDSWYDVVFYKGLLFAVTMFSKIVSFNFGCSNDHLGKMTITSNVVLGESLEQYCYLEHKYLVISLKEELWMVTKESSFCHVFKLQLDVKSKKLEQMFELKCLGDNILFLGAGDSTSVSASYFSKSLQRNSIYFANLNIYNMKSEKTTFISLTQWDSSNFWILPNFRWN